MTSVTLLTTSPGGRVAHRFTREVEKRGATIKIVAPGDDYTPDGQSVVLPRIAPHMNTEGVAALEALARSGVTIVNSPGGWLTSRDKAKAAAVFEAAHIATPRTLAVASGTRFADCAQALGQPFIVKVVDGTHGEGVHLVGSEEQLRELLASHHRFIAQQFIAEASGTDMRLLVVDGRVVAAMRRQAKPGEFRSNLHLGAEGSAYQPSAKEADLAVAATKALGLEVAGVDIVSSAAGPLVLEVNPSPGLLIETVTGVNVVGAIADYILSVSTRT